MAVSNWTGEPYPSIARGVLAATMTDAYAAADAILADHFGEGSGTEVMPVQHEAHMEDVDLEGVLREVERTVKDRSVLLQWMAGGRRPAYGKLKENETGEKRAFNSMDESQGHSDPHKASY
ncbi:hypothetical protein BC826DRAFT_1178828 [Russula brevipes]|nr:hypothetical protein BC826DRAFT_1178828 [Russula brevipes]